MCPDCATAADRLVEWKRDRNARREAAGRRDQGAAEGIVVAHAAEGVAKQLEAWGIVVAVVFVIGGVILVISGVSSLDTSGGMGFVGIGAGIGCGLVGLLFYAWHRAGATALLLLGKLVLKE